MSLPYQTHFLCILSFNWNPRDYLVQFGVDHLWFLVLVDRLVIARLFDPNRTFKPLFLFPALECRSWILYRLKQQNSNSKYKQLFLQYQIRIFAYHCVSFCIYHYYSYLCTMSIFYDKSDGILSDIILSKSEWSSSVLWHGHNKRTIYKRIFIFGHPTRICLGYSKKFPKWNK